MPKQKIINKVFDKLDILNDKLKKSQNEVDKQNKILWEIKLYRNLLKMFDELDNFKFYQNKEKRKIELIMQLLTSTAVLLSETKQDAINKYLCFVDCISLLKDY